MVTGKTLLQRLAIKYGLPENASEVEILTAIAQQSEALGLRTGAKLALFDKFPERKDELIESIIKDETNS